MECGKCHEPLQPGQVFCTRCGEMVAAVTGAAQGVKPSEQESPVKSASTIPGESGRKENTGAEWDSILADLNNLVQNSAPVAGAKEERVGDKADTPASEPADKEIQVAAQPSVWKEILPPEAPPAEVTLNKQSAAPISRDEVALGNTAPLQPVSATSQNEEAPAVHNGAVGVQTMEEKAAPVPPKKPEQASVTETGFTATAAVRQPNTAPQPMAAPAQPASQPQGTVPPLGYSHSSTGLPPAGQVYGAPAYTGPGNHWTAPATGAYPGYSAPYAPPSGHMPQGWGYYAPAVPPVWTPKKEALPVKEEQVGGASLLLSTGELFKTLLLGLLPLAGIVFCLIWAFGKGAPAQKRNLAKAILWLHGILLILALVGLAVWVLVLLFTGTGGLV